MEFVPLYVNQPLFADGDVELRARPVIFLLNFRFHNQNRIDIPNESGFLMLLFALFLTWDATSLTAAGLKRGFPGN